MRKKSSVQDNTNTNIADPVLNVDGSLSRYETLDPLVRNIPSTSQSTTSINISCDYLEPGSNNVLPYLTNIFTDDDNLTRNNTIATSTT